MPVRTIAAETRVFRTYAIDFDARRLSRMKQHARAILLCLLAGASLTLLIAWTLAVTVDVYAKAPKGGSGPDGDWHWSVFRQEGFGSMRIESNWHFQQNPGRTAIPPEQYAPRWSRLHERPPDEFIHASRLIDARGWPWIAFWCDVKVVTARAPGDLDVQHIVHGQTTPLPDWNKLRMFPGERAIPSPRVLPFRPVWGGFILNSFVYGLLLWTLFIATFAARRVLRRRRRLCEQCAYPIGVSPVCTECGAAVRPMARRA